MSLVYSWINVLSASITLAFSLSLLFSNDLTSKENITYASIRCLIFLIFAMLTFEVPSIRLLQLVTLAIGVVNVLDAIIGFKQRKIIQTLIPSSIGLIQFLVFIKIYF